MRFSTERSFEPNAQPPIGMDLNLYVDLEGFHRAALGPNLNRIPKWCGMAMARGLRLHRSTIGNMSEASWWK